jgi:hypothetical protein
MRHFFFAAPYIRPFRGASPAAKVRPVGIGGSLRVRRRVRQPDDVGRRALTRHFVSPGTVDTLARRVGPPTLSGRLVALAGLALRLTSRHLRTAVAVDMAAVAVAADQHLITTTLAQKQPGRCFRWPRLARKWTASAIFATSSAHTCSTRCEGTAPSFTCQVWSAPCLPFRQVVTTPSALTHAACARRAGIQCDLMIN